MTYFQPLTAVILVLGVLALIRSRHSRGQVLLACSVIGLFAVSWPPLEWLFSRPLESRYRIQPLPSGPADAIVVLSSGVEPPRYGRSYYTPDKKTSERCRFAAWLYRQWRQLPVLACGGRSDAIHQPFSATMREILQDEGVPDAMIWTEEQSRSTYENAAYGAEILRRRGIRTIALVVEARSMPRAEACFRRLGFRIVPAPSSFDEAPHTFEDWVPDWRAIGRNETTLHEVAGLLWYKLHGWI